MTRSTRLPRCAAALAALALGACATPETATGPNDPYESFNRGVHGVNVALDRNLLRPVAQGYDAVTPELFQHLIGNGLDHLALPGDFANDLLQGQPRRALATFGRFALNTVMGAGGLLDPATEFGLERRPNDFGVTLGKVGVAEGPYVVIPLLGPSNPRDAVGTVVDFAFRPTTYIGAFADAAVMEPVVEVVSVVDARNRNAAFIDEALYNSPDSYVTLRSVYQQRRRAQVRGGTTEETLPDIFDDETEAPPQPVSE